MLSDISYSLAHTEDSRYFIEYQGNYYHINEDSHRLLVLLKQDRTLSEIADEMKVDITEICEFTAEIRKVLTHPPVEKIKPLVPLLNSVVCDFIGAGCQFLFRKPVFYTLILISGLVSAWTAFTGVGASFLSLSTGLGGYLLALFLIVFLHELGHICAAGFFGLKQLKLSLGVYVLWPVFFVSLNRQVLLPRNKRIIVSAGGLYFQLLLSLVVIGLNLIQPSDFFRLIWYLNLGLIALNILPILILDGYWIYSDACKIDNLDTKAKALLGWRQLNSHRWSMAPFAVKGYALLRLLTQLLLWSFAGYYLINHLQYFPGMVELLMNTFSIQTLFRAMLLILPYLFFIFYCLKTLHGKRTRNS